MSEDSNTWFGTEVAPGSAHSFSMRLTESSAGAEVSIPITVWRGEGDGPTVGVTAAVHGDEINGTGAIRRIIREKPFELIAGTLVLVPVVNMLGYERHSRYLPDRRDLNRSFPGSRDGSLASRLARSFFDGIVRRCDFIIDLHTAAVRRTNFPNVRADLDNEALAPFARAFGASLTVNGQGPKGSLRATACRTGTPTLILEAGEVWKVEPGVVEYTIRGIDNCLRHLGMVEGEPKEPPYRVEVDTTKWIRATHGGFLEFHVGPGDIVAKDEPLATNADLLGESQNVIRAPRDGIVLGMTTIPSVVPGDPVCHLAFPKLGQLRKMGRAVDGMDSESLHERIKGELASSMQVTDSGEAS